MLRLTVLTMSLAVSPAALAADCSTYAVAKWGKERPETLRGTARKALLDFARQEPKYVPGMYRSGANAQRPPLSWHPISKLAEVRRIGVVGGRLLFAVLYSEMKIVLAWEQEDWSFCPIFLLDGQEGIVGWIGDPHVFAVDGQSLASIRVYYRGNGAIQESFFFGVVDGQLIHLEQQAFVPVLQARGIEVSHRGGGFCPDALVWEKSGWLKDSPEQGGLLRATYAVAGASLEIAQVELITDVSTKGCDPYYESRARVRR